MITTTSRVFPPPKFRYSVTERIIYDEFYYLVTTIIGRCDG